ncbi:Lrp/AsnC family transcriptional regulator [Pseudomonas asiatica]|uniref:Lrp/AsnC family transcriptional regulator n=1 Tax=Pseudomonas asiatica TaxID=2219225 RepID=UPI00209B002C|nr:Lrp/AsnC family transcriptional regulator [Pseudomonas asiatica]MCO7524860.1 Lrp/AsnC family transcriptional regulator [Pseudomonas asiatica]
MSNEAYKVDAVDLRIISALQSEARLSSAELAERVALSASPCWRRVKRLEELGIIKGYHASIDAQKLGYSIFAFVQVSLGQKDSESMRRFEDEMLSHDQIVFCHCISGNYDYQLAVIAPNLAEFNNFARSVINGFPGVKDVFTSFSVNEVKPYQGF